MNRLGQILSQQADLLFVGVLVAAVALFVVPMPTALIDVFVAINLALAFLIIVATIYMRRTLDLSAFPAIVLISATFRLALTVSTSRLVLSQGDAGEIIRAFGEFVIGGNIVVGLVTFAIIALVQFIVVTKGAERIAEVSARFTLDSIPGKQLAIDADLRSGSISAAVAQSRREVLERESQFFGAMDGAMRFVKGDAIAALVVILVNLIGGLATGVLQHGMSFGEAAQLYSLLSVGDGLVAQIPSMLTAIASGIIVSRTASYGSQDLGTQVFQQIGTYPRALQVAAILTASGALLPGFPSLTLLVIGGALFLLSRYVKEETREASAPTTSAENTPTDTAPPPARLDRAKYGDPFVATVTRATFEMLERGNFALLMEDGIRIAARKVGVAVTVPTFQIDDRMIGSAIHLQIENVPVAMIRCPPERELGESAAEIGFIARRYVGFMFSLADAVNWLASLENRVGALATEVKAKVPLLTIVGASRILLASGVTLSQPRAFLEILLETADTNLEPEQIAENGRRVLAKQIVYAFIDGRGALPVISLDPAYEERLHLHAPQLTSIMEVEGRQGAQQMAKSTGALLAEANARGIEPVVLVAEDIRSKVQAHLIDNACPVPALSFYDVPADVFVDTVATLLPPGAEEAA